MLKRRRFFTLSMKIYGVLQAHVKISILVCCMQIELIFQQVLPKVLPKLTVIVAWTVSGLYKHDQ